MDNLDTPEPEVGARAELPGSLDEEFRTRALDAVRVLQEIHENRRVLAALDEGERRELLTVAGQVARPGPYAKRELAREVRKRRKEEIRRRDEAVLATTGIRKKRAEAVFQTPKLGPAPQRPVELLEGDCAGVGEHAAVPVPQLQEERTCYVCKIRFRELHHFYDQMCPSCAELNYQKRHQTADLRGRVALITGARVKIGFQAAIMLLRAGAHVIVTTRFPRDAAKRYLSEEDCAEWSHRLEIHGLDLRHTPSVEAFAKHLVDTKDRLDFILSNACQTVRKPVGFYKHLMPDESRAITECSSEMQSVLANYEELRSQAILPSIQPDASALTITGGQVSSQTAGLQDPAALSQLALVDEDLDGGDALFPSGRLDQDLQQVDLRGRNSWRLGLAEVSTVELLEVQLVNAVAPFVLNSRLKELMLRQPGRDKHIVNVSAMEGQFYRSFKTDKHPHTNMAKAALNMMTRTSAADYIKDGIHMNSVDTGWITDEDPVEIARRKTEEHGFHPPLDIVDGAARIVDPIFDGFNTGTHRWGLFFKDYAPTDW